MRLTLDKKLAAQVTLQDSLDLVELFVGHHIVLCTLKNSHGNSGDGLDVVCDSEGRVIGNCYVDSGERVFLRQDEGCA